MQQQEKIRMKKRRCKVRTVLNKTVYTYPQYKADEDPKEKS